MLKFASYIDWAGGPKCFFLYMFEILFAILFLTILRNISMMKLNLNEQHFEIYILHRRGRGSQISFFVYSKILFPTQFLTILRNISMMKLNLNEQVFKMYILNRMGPGTT